jgi:hypothetical protein
MFEKRQDLSNNINPIIENNIYYEIWNNMYEKLDPFSKQILKYKFDYYFNNLNSNKRISELMCCSEETIRQNLKKSKKVINNIIIKYDI